MSALPSSAESGLDAPRHPDAHEDRRWILSHPPLDPVTPAVGSCHTDGQGLRPPEHRPARIQAAIRRPFHLSVRIVDMTDVAKHIDYHTAVAYQAHTFHNS